MAELNSLFKKFLSNIEPDDKAVKYAQKAHTTVRDYLKEDEKFGVHVGGSFLYGSYKRHTAVGDIKDVDIVVLTDFDPFDQENTPQSVLRKLKAALARCYDDPENPQYQRRSIRIVDPLPDAPDVFMTLDIIPAAAINGEENVLLVPDRESKQWVKSHPKAHLAFTSQLNSPEISEQRFVPLVKMVKWWWKHQSSQCQPKVERPKPKGFWLEILTGHHFDRLQHDLADHFITLLESVSRSYSPPTKVPELPDPGITGQTIKTSMEFNEFQLFMETVNESLELAYEAKKASSEGDNARGSELWREIFGEEFPLYDADETEESRSLAAIVPLGVTLHIEQVKWPLALNKEFRVSLNAFTYYNNQKLGGLNSGGRKLHKGIDLKFIAKTNVPKPFEVHWQVVNTGKHAAESNDLRGVIFRHSASLDQFVRHEHTQYAGRHWIECFIVKNGSCIARSGRFYVVVQ